MAALGFKMNLNKLRNYRSKIFGRRCSSFNKGEEEEEEEETSEFVPKTHSYTIKHHQAWVIANLYSESQ